jgi:hypothetical protein
MAVSRLNLPRRPVAILVILQLLFGGTLCVEVLSELGFFALLLFVCVLFHVLAS